jgi:integrase
MTAVAATLPAPERQWTPPLSPAAYDRCVALSREERRALALIADRPGRWPAGVAEALARFTAPVNDVLAVAGLKPGSWAGAPTRGDLLQAIGREGMAFWGWDRAQWERTVAGGNVAVRQLLIAVAYQLCAINDLHWEIRGFKMRLFCGRVFGHAAVEETVGRVQSHLDSLGSAAQLQRPSLQRALYELMLAARSPLLDDLAKRPELLPEIRDRTSHNPGRSGFEQLARTMVDMGVLSALPFPARLTRDEWLARSRAGDLDVPELWLDYAKRWFQTSTLSRSSRSQTYFALIKVGRWINHEQPDHADPGSWTRELAAGWVARVDRMLVGEYSHGPNTAYMRRRSGGELLPRTKAHLIWALRRFFNDIQEWEWIERRFDARRAFTLPRSIASLIGPEPRVIADDIWAKLMWAGLNLTVEDLPRHASSSGEPWYPLELVRAVALVWLFSGLRSDEILRLRLGAIRWQTNTADTDGNPARVCLLDVPTNKTATAFTKPVDSTVGDAIDAWEQVRPPHPKFIDRKTGELADMLLCFRGHTLSTRYINRTLVPLLCRKAGVPRDDVRGAITGHRARATIATQLYNAKDPMTLFELQAWLGHSSPASTQHYARITPTTLTKAYTDAGYFARNVRTIEVLLDRDAITNGQAGNGGPFEFYDLGHGYCTYTFFEQCPHRMACARCDFYLPKESSAAQLLEAEDGLQRMLVQIPLTDTERAAVEGDQRAVHRLIDLLADTPTPAGRAPRELLEKASLERPTSRHETAARTEASR